MSANRTTFIALETAKLILFIMKKMTLSAIFFLKWNRALRDSANLLRFFEQPQTLFA